MSFNDLVAAAAAVSSPEPPSSASKPNAKQARPCRTRADRAAASNKHIDPANQPVACKLQSPVRNSQQPAAPAASASADSQQELAKQYMTFFMQGFVSHKVKFCHEAHNVATRAWFTSQFWGCLAARAGERPKLSCFAQASRGVNNSFFVADESMRIETGGWCDSDHLILTHSWQSAQVQQSLVDTCTYASWAAHDFHVLETMFLAYEVDASSYSSDLRRHPLQNLPSIDRWNILNFTCTQLDRNWIFANFPSLRLYLQAENRKMYALVYTIVTALGCKVLMHRNKLNDSLVNRLYSPAA